MCSKYANHLRFNSQHISGDLYDHFEHKNLHFDIK